MAPPPDANFVDMNQAVGKSGPETLKETLRAGWAPRIFPPQKVTAPDTFSRNGLGNSSIRTGWDHVQVITHRLKGCADSQQRRSRSVPNWTPPAGATPRWRD